MRFISTEFNFLLKASTLFAVLTIGVFTQSIQPSPKNSDQDVINIENKAPKSDLRSFVVNKTSPKIIN